MIDCHVHTLLCNHAIGSAEECVQAAVQRRLRILGFSEHGPFICDHGRRMTEQQARDYVLEIRRIQAQYASSVTILAGMEMDYAPEADEYLRNFLATVKLDYVYVGIHFVGPDRVPVWDYQRMSDPYLWDEYFVATQRAIASGLFDGLVHPDILLRYAMPADMLIKRIQRLGPMLATNKNVVRTYTHQELDFGGLFKFL